MNSSSVAESAASDASHPDRSTAQRVAGYEALNRILAFIRDADVDAHDSLHNDVEALYNLMIRWRIAAQRWTPGGSEYMDPAYCERFIGERRAEASRATAKLHQLRRAMTVAHDLCLSTAPKQAVGEVLAFALSSEMPDPVCEQSEQSALATDTPND